jgi:hypothetical protein
VQDVMRCDWREWTVAGRHARARASETVSENKGHCWAEQHRAPGKQRWLGEPSGSRDYGAALHSTAYGGRERLVKAGRAQTHAKQARAAQ